MKSSVHPRVTRGLAAGLGFALAGGLSLVAIAPAHAGTSTASTTTNVTSDDFQSGSNWIQGWQDGSNNGAGATHSVTVNGLELSKDAQVAYGTSDGDGNPVTFDELTTAITDGLLSETTASGSTHLQLQFGDDQGNIITLSSAAATSGTTTAALSQTWTTDTDIASYDEEVAGTPDFATGASASLGDFLTALAGNDGTSFTGFALSADVASAITGVTWNDTAFTFIPPLPGNLWGTVTVSGTPAVGQTLTGKVDGWPAGTTFSYQWGWNGGQMGGPVDGATATTLKVPADLAGRNVMMFATATAPGYSAVRSSSMQVFVAAPKKPAAKAPVKDDTALAAMLTANMVTPQTQTSTGLPSGQLNPNASYTPTLSGFTQDSYVDVYVYSTATFVGTFPVVNGKVKVDLSKDVLRTLASGNHTLLVTGQSSGTIQAVSLKVAPSLADTGSDVTLPLSAAALLLLAGAGLLVARRRRAVA